MSLADSTWARAKKPKPAPAPPKRDMFLTVQGKGNGWQGSFAVLCGDNPPTPTAGGAKITTIDRPMLRGLTVFTGYDPVALTVEMRFGRWTSSWEWLTDDTSGQAVAVDMHKLRTMWGMFQGAGMPPFVYLNSYDSTGRSTALIPLELQQTSGIVGSLANANTWPWLITGITWGNDQITNPSGWPVHRTCTVTLLAYQGLSQPSTRQVGGGYFTTAPGRDTMLLIAQDPNPNGASVRPDVLAGQIRSSQRNNPVRGSHLYLERKRLNDKLPHGRQIWVPGHVV